MPTLDQCTALYPNWTDPKFKDSKTGKFNQAAFDAARQPWRAAGCEAVEKAALVQQTENTKLRGRLILGGASLVAGVIGYFIGRL